MLPANLHSRLHFVLLSFPRRLEQKKQKTKNLQSYLLSLLQQDYFAKTFYCVHPWDTVTKTLKTKIEKEATKTNIGHLRLNFHTLVIVCFSYRGFFKFSFFFSRRNVGQIINKFELKVWQCWNKQAEYNDSYEQIITSLVHELSPGTWTQRMIYFSW